MFNLSAGLITIGIQITMFPHFVKLFHGNKFEELKILVSKAKKWSIVATIISALIMTRLIPILINLLFIGGKFSKDDAQNAISLIPFFIIPTIGWGIAPVFLQPLSAIGKQILSGKIQIAAGIFGWISAYICQYYFAPLVSISFGLTVLLFTIIIASHISWKQCENKL
jgi:peptidoglycan biosynthesis protein MviN/MurJ (putative lipid II flippase)